MINSIFELEHLKTKRVVLRTIRDSLYTGYLSGFNAKKQKICLTKMVILSKDGKVNATASDIIRWFNLASVKSVDELESWEKINGVIQC